MVRNEGVRGARFEGRVGAGAKVGQVGHCTRFLNRFVQFKLAWEVGLAACNIAATMLVIMFPMTHVWYVWVVRSQL